MSPADDTSATLEALLAAVARDRDSRCQALLSDAGQRARELLQDARGDARRLLRHAVEEERRLDREGWRRADARIETHHRLQQQRVNLQRLERGWVLLVDALRRRWHEAETRRQWVETALKHARLVLHPDHWTIAHPPDWGQQERVRIHEWLHDSAGVNATFEAEESIEAGLCVRRDQACFDATLDGLLVARHRIEAQFLAAFEEPAQ
ncbi:MAG TPA: hypothetical protein VIX81_01595 [Gammaproteobacteria bacterium]